MLAATIENAEEPPTVVAAKFTELAFDLRTVREGQVRIRLVEQIYALDLTVYRKLNGLGLRSDEIVDWLRPSGAR